MLWLGPLQTSVDRVTVLPSNDGSTAKKAVTLVEELKAGTGIDIPQIVDRMTAGSDAKAPSES